MNRNRIMFLCKYNSVEPYMLFFFNILELLWINVNFFNFKISYIDLEKNMCLYLSRWFFYYFLKIKEFGYRQILVIHKAKKVFICYNFYSRFKFIYHICTFEHLSVSLRIIYANIWNKGKWKFHHLQKDINLCLKQLFQIISH